jgi:hypothetical protein
VDIRRVVFAAGRISPPDGAETAFFSFLQKTHVVLLFFFCPHRAPLSSSQTPQIKQLDEQKYVFQASLYFFLSWVSETPRKKKKEEKRKKTKTTVKKKTHIFSLFDFVSLLQVDPRAPAEVAKATSETTAEGGRDCARE